MKEKKEGTPIKCSNLRCRHKWIYKGNSKFYATCPQCYNKVRLEYTTHNKKEKTTTHKPKPKVRPIE